MEEIKELEMLKEFKKNSGWSFEKIAREIGVSHQTVMAWFYGKYTPNNLSRRAIKAFLIEHL